VLTDINDEEWYVWTVRSGKFEEAKYYIEQRIPEVKKILYPTVTIERITKKGIKKNKEPLYAGYLFLQYEHTPVTWNKLKVLPFIKRYVGPCTAQDLASVDSLQKVEALNNDEVKNFIIGDRVRVNGGVFVGFTGVICGVMSNYVRADLERVGKTLRVTFSPEDLDILERK